MNLPPSPWNWQASGSASANGDHNLYVIDATNRKIAAVWGKRGEKERTCAVLAAASDLKAACEQALEYVSQIAGTEHIEAVLRAALARCEDFPQ